MIYNVVLEHFAGPCCEACGILVPQPGIKPLPPAVEPLSPNCWTARDIPEHAFMCMRKFQLRRRGCIYMMKKRQLMT